MANEFLHPLFGRIVESYHVHSIGKIACLDRISTGFQLTTADQFAIEINDRVLKIRWACYSDLTTVYDIAYQLRSRCSACIPERYDVRLILATIIECYIHAILGSSIYIRFVQEHTRINNRFV